MKLFAKSDDGILGKESLGIDELVAIVALAGIPFFGEPSEPKIVTCADSSI